MTNMKLPDYHLYLTDDEYSQVIHCLVELKNKMMEQGRYTDVIDEVLLKVTSKNISPKAKKYGIIEPTNKVGDLDAVESICRR